MYGQRRPVNPRQLEVLTWIGAGCPPRDWPDESHKTSAKALQNRGLVTVSRRGGHWNAVITDAGHAYLDTGGYPEATKPPSVPEAPRRRNRSAAPMERSPATQPTQSLHLQRAEDLIAQLVANDGSLDLGEVERDFDVRRIEQAARSASNRPPDRLLRFEGYGPWHTNTYRAYLEEDLSVGVGRVPVPVPARLVRPYPAVRDYKADVDRHDVSASSLNRACRILQALAAAAEGRGYRMAPIKHTARYHAEFRSSLSQGQVVIKIDGFSYGLRIREIAGKGATKISPHDRRARPRWIEVRGYAFIPTGRLKLSITTHGVSRDGRPFEFQDSKSRTLEETLPVLLWELAVRAREDARTRDEKLQQEQRKKQRWQLAMDQAKRELVQRHRLGTLTAQSERWAGAKVARNYIAAMRDRVAGMDADSAEKSQAEEWLDWCERNVDSLDPLQGSLQLPESPRPTADNLAPFLGGWSFYGP